ncbi:hypothetical protein OR1_03687 [Geobacter sp. OR-1]|uniref:hypothetical protein n=1 Tax=Geobacter sp. OR-1 TaxID=1266765 RepID=UPI000543CC21|nr:hypothetical protein [Geobacter sp. OR-1]GAM11372.1 hypothetical protein OR1_03687 [Geobacter sp. OR-1]
MPTPAEVLKKIHPGLISRNSDINESLFDFHNSLAYAFNNFRQAIESAGKVSERLKPEERLKDQQEIMKKAFTNLQAEFDKAAHPYKSRTGTILQEIETASRPATHKSETAELIALLRAQEIRRELSTLPPDERTALLRSTVAAGDPSILFALEGSILPLIPAPVVELAKVRYQETALPDKIEALNVAGIFEDSVTTSERFMKSAAADIAKAEGLGAIFDSMSDPDKAAFMKMTEGEKTAFISDNGLDAFKESLR